MIQNLDVQYFTGILCCIAIVAFAACNQPNQKTEAGDNPASLDPLPSWKDGTTKSAIIQFVSEVTKVGGSNYVQEKEQANIVFGSAWLK